MRLALKFLICKFVSVANLQNLISGENMFRKTLASLLFLGFSLYAGSVSADQKSCHHHNDHNRSHVLRDYAVLSNQVAVTDGTNVTWAPLPNAISSGISVDSLGRITLPTGLYLVEYTVRLSRTPVSDTSTVVTQLQQTVGGIPTNIAQAAVTSNTAIDGVTNSEPASQTQITGYAIIEVTSSTNNIINLAVDITGSQLSIPAASGVDANAQMFILQLK